ncbi:TonB-dependent siderophore receptor [Sphingomonas corticis]|jgi:outer membrane receptor for ferric coprogen and ferric-rhodotorulic acid|uniref:TonB-dependent siderophore receptor n=1 Tax=Sphingomonas corticis TaxID=2722791 RepID=A0ABX1CIS7_9SPHN|nr:TonB-dependent siderophore receptor [Sphingomonas corticis]NJR77863.1 TonB-dependent siderophore receptor [Sphingomonas corticis]
MTRSLLIGLLATAAFPATAMAEAPVADTGLETAGDTTADPQNDLIVTGARASAADDKQSASPTGLSLSLRETPQSLTIVDRERIDSFALTNVNDLLTQTVGINVERTETDRTEFNSRGFDITNFQFDGIGLPMFFNIQTGDLDTVLFERVEAVRGANAIMTGVGNPSATINYLRKRPTREFRANASAFGGSFDLWRLEGDVSGPLTADGSLRIRAIGAHEERASYLDYNHVNRDVFAGLIAWDATPDLTVTAGYSLQDNRSDGVLWGALPLVYSDGSRIDYPRSASTSADWTYWNVRDQTAFAEVAYKLGGDWSLRGVATYRHWRERARILYAYYANGVGADPATGQGIVGLTGTYPSKYEQLLFDGYASGSVNVFGRDHQLAFGVATGRSDGEQFSASSLGGAIDYGDIRQLASFRAPLPAYAPLVQQADTYDRLTRAYGAAHLNLTDRVKGVVGATAIWLRSGGLSYGADQTRRNDKVSPYLGVLYDLTSSLTLYASYTDIFNPQREVDRTNVRLDPAKGTSIEGGIKGEWLDGRLYGSAAVFRAKQSGLAVVAGQFVEGEPGQIGTSYYTGQDTTSKGFEIEVAGRVANRWLLSGGFTHLSIEDEQGSDARTFIPRDTLKLAATYTVPEWRDFKLGAQFRYQSEISTPSSVVVGGTAVPIVQDAFATLDLLAGIRLAEHVTATVNVRNVNDAKYLGTLKYGQAFYAAPRSVIATLRFDY